MEEVVSKNCRRCGKDKSIYEFHENRTCKDGRLGICRICVKEIQKERRDKASIERMRKEIKELRSRKVIKEFRIFGIYFVIGKIGKKDFAIVPQ